jgi:hypothetical protein
MDIYAAVPPALAEEAGIKSQRLGSLGMLASRGIGIVEFNRVLGFGLSPLAQSSVLTSALQWLDANAGSAWVVQPVPGSEAAAEIRRLGFEAVGNGWAKLVGKTPAAMNQAARTELAVELVDHTSAGRFGQIVARGFGLPSSVEPWFSALVGRPQWRCYLAYREEQPVACGALYVDADMAWLGIDATLPEWRNRGAQSALIRRRHADGFASGATMFTAETAQPPTPHASSGGSYRNYLRAGFEKAYTRLNYRRP